MPRLRLQLRNQIYYYRWELQGRRTMWIKGLEDKVDTVEMAFMAVKLVLPLEN